MDPRAELECRYDGPIPADAAYTGPAGISYGTSPAELDVQRRDLEFMAQRAFTLAAQLMRSARIAKASSSAWSEDPWVRIERARRQRECVTRYVAEAREANRSGVCLRRSAIRSAAELNTMMADALHARAAAE